MPNNTLEKWEEKPFEKCIENIQYTNKIPKKDFKDNGLYPIISQEDEFINGYWNDKKDLFIIKKPVVIFGDHTKKVKYIDFDFVLGADGVKIISTIDNILPKYMYYYLQNIQLRDLGYARHYKLLKEKFIQYPNIHEQQRIVGILDEAFKNIEKAKQNALQNLNNAKELFEIESNNIFEQLLNKYEPIKMSEIANLITKGASPKWQGFKYCEKGKDSILFITSENVGKEELILENKKYLNKSFNAKQQRSILEKGDILTNIVGASIGRTTIFDIDELCNINQAVCLIRLKDKKQNKYVTKYMNSNCAIKSMTGMIKDCARANVSLTNIADLYVPLPIPEEQQKIVAQLDELQEQTKKLEQIYEQRIKDLDELKQSILQKAFNGKL